MYKDWEEVRRIKDLTEYMTNIVDAKNNDFCLTIIILPKLID
jgi:hypothetical protein